MLLSCFFCLYHRALASLWLGSLVWDNPPEWHLLHPPSSFIEILFMMHSSAWEALCILDCSISGLNLANLVFDYHFAWSRHHHLLYVPIPIIIFVCHSIKGELLKPENSDRRL